MGSPGCAACPGLQSALGGTWPAHQDHVGGLDEDGFEVFVALEDLA
jgi:hypothetical protein